MSPLRRWLIFHQFFSATQTPCGVWTFSKCWTWARLGNCLKSFHSVEIVIKSETLTKHQVDHHMLCWHSWCWHNDFWKFWNEKVPIPSGRVCWHLQIHHCHPSGWQMYVNWGNLSKSVQHCVYTTSSPWRLSLLMHLKHFKDNHCLLSWQSWWWHNW